MLYFLIILAFSDSSMVRGIHKIEISATIERFMLFLSSPPYNPKQSFHRIRFHSILFVFFLLSLPFSIRKVFGVFSPDGSFNEYLDISLYLSDVLLIITLGVSILENKKRLLSISYWRNMFHVEHLLLPIFIPAFFILWSGLSILWSENAVLATISFIRLIEWYLLYLYIIIGNVPRGTSKNEYTQSEMFHVEHSDNIIKNVPRGTFQGLVVNYIKKCSTWNILRITLVAVIITGFLQSIVAILQFIKQKSLGLTFLKESIFNVYDPGIAKIVINGDVFIRSYGFFPHPNVLGGFLALSLLITMAYPLIFKSEMFHVEHFLNIWLYRALIFTQLLALSFSFSKSAIVAFVIGLVILAYGIHKMFHVEHSDNVIQNVPRGTFQSPVVGFMKKCSTWNIPGKSIMRILHKMFHVEHLFIIGAVIIVGMMALSVNLKLFIIQPFVERLFYMSSIKGLFEGYYFQGLGIGQFVYTMQHFFNEKLLLWQLQPIHNVFLLIFSEVGIVGLGLFLWFLVFVFLRNNENVPRGTFQGLVVNHMKKCSTWNIPLSVVSGMFHVEHSLGDRKIVVSYLFRSLLIVILFIMLFDHYFWDIQQGQLLLWIILAFSVSYKEY